MAQYPIEKKSDEIEDALKKIQGIFDEYQNKCFTAKSPEFFCLELNGEAGELANLEKKAWKGRDIEFAKFEDEAADVLIALMNYSNAKKVNLGDAVKEKLLKIESKRNALAGQGKDF